jgi:hypothetical protein
MLYQCYKLVGHCHSKHLHAPVIVIVRSLVLRRHDNFSSQCFPPTHHTLIMVIGCVWNVLIGRWVVTACKPQTVCDESVVFSLVTC